MKYFIFTYQGEGLPIAYRLQQEGHDVIVGFVDNSADVHASAEGIIPPENPAWKHQRLSLFDGMVKKVDAWELIERIKQKKNYRDCFVFFDRNNLFKFAHALSSLPIAGNFPTEADYLLEQNREMAKQFVAKNYPAFSFAMVKNFSTVTQAKEFLKKRNDTRWVLKGRNDEAATYIPESSNVAIANEQIVQTLIAHKEVYEESGFILEQFIESFVEVTPEKIYYDGKPISLALYLENKPLGSGNTSIQTGCAQDIYIPISFDHPIHDIAFPPIVDALAKKHKGLFLWDASLLIDTKSNNIYFGEFCSNRPGYNTIFSEIAQCPSVNHFFTSIMEKRNPFTLGMLGGSVRIFTMNRDSETEQLSSDIPLLFTKQAEKNIWLWDVKEKKKQLVTVGYDWSTAVVTGQGASFKEVADSIYKNADAFSFVGSYYRPQFDYLSREYPTSLANRLQFAIEKKLFTLPFDL